jgi:hypothetical protein
MAKEGYERAGRYKEVGWRMKLEQFFKFED